MSDAAIVAMVLVASLVAGAVVGSFGYWIYNSKR